MKTINLQKQKSLILILLALFAVAPLVGWASSSDLAFSFKYGGTTYYTDYLTTAVYLADNNSTITVRNSTGNFSSTKNSNNTIPITYYYINSNSTGTAYSYNPVLNNSNNGSITETRKITIRSAGNNTYTITRSTAFFSIWMNPNPGKTVDITVENVIFDGNNISTEYAMFIYYDNTQNQTLGTVNLTINNCVFKNCKRNGVLISGNGGAINMFGTKGTLTCNNVVFEDNEYNTVNYHNPGDMVYGGGAIALQRGTKFTLTNCKFYGNKAEDAGGAIYMLYAGTGTISNCTIGEPDRGNIAKVAGGGIYCTLYDNSDLTVTGTTIIQNNRVEPRQDSQNTFNNGYVELGHGGGIYLINGRSNSHLFVGEANNGNPFSNESDMVIIRNNYARGGGGGMTIWCNKGNKTGATLQNVLFCDNMGDDNTGPKFKNSSGNVINVEYGGGGLFVYGDGSETHTDEHLQIANCIFRDNYAKNSGGAILFNNHDATVTNVTFSDNYTELGTTNSGIEGWCVSRGGAVMVIGKDEDYTLADHDNKFVNCTFVRNGIYTDLSNPENPVEVVKTQYGGAICATDKVQITVLGGTIGGSETNANKVSIDGGGIYIGPNSYLSVDSYGTTCAEISYNEAENDGGGIYVSNGSQGHTDIGSNSSTTYPVKINLNKAGSNGGGIYLDCGGTADDLFTMKYFQLNNNTAPHGGGAYLLGEHVSNVAHGAMIISDGEVKENHASSMGGGIFFDEHDATVTNVDFILNTTDENASNNEYGVGGGVLMVGHSNHSSAVTQDYLFTNCTFEENAASFGGAAMVRAKATATFSNCTIGGYDIEDEKSLGNTASVDGGGVYVEERSKAIFNNSSKVQHNTADIDGGGIYVAGYEASGPTPTSMNAACEATYVTQYAELPVMMGIYTKNGSVYNLVSGTSMTLTNSSGSGVLEALGLATDTDYYVLVKSNNYSLITNYNLFSLSCILSGISGKVQIYNAGWTSYEAVETYHWNKPKNTNISTLIHNNWGNSSSGGYYYDIIHFRVEPDPVTDVFGEVIVDGSEVSNNVATRDGGGIFNSGLLTMTNSTMKSNAATDDGGGIFAAAPGITTLKGCTLGGLASDKNTASSGKGGGVYKLGTLRVADLGSTNMIITENTCGTADVEVTNNVYIPTAAVQKYVLITDEGLGCGSRIGITKTKRWKEKDGFDNAGTNDTTQLYGNQGEHVYYLDDNFKQVRTAVATIDPSTTGSSAANYPLLAYKRDVFFDDTDNYRVWCLNYSKSNVASRAYTIDSCYFIETWRNFARNIDPDDVTLSSDFVTHVHSPEGLSYFAKQVNNGNDYSDKTVIQTTEIDLSGHYWEPIGILYCGDCGAADKPFAGTFNGNGHLTSGTLSILPVKAMGLFGNVTGTVKHTFAIGEDLTYTLVGTGGGLGGLVGNVASGGVIDGCESALFTLTGYSASCYAGGIAGMVAGEMRNSFAAGNIITTATETNITASGGMAGLVSGQVKNGYAINVGLAGSSQGGLVGNNAGTLENCYSNASTGNLVGTGTSGSSIYAAGASGATYTYTPTITTDELGYMYSDNLVNSTPMFEQLNTNASGLNGSSSHTYTYWARPTLAEINGDLPVLLLDNYNSSDKIGLGGFRSLGNVKTQAENATNHAYVLQYSGPNRDDEGNTPSFTSPANPELDGALTRENAGKSLFIYGDITEAPTVSSTSITADKISVYEHSAILNPGTLSDYTNTYVGISFDNSSNGAWSTPQINHLDSQFLPRDWHMFSTPLANAPLGFDYTITVGEQEINTNLSQYYPDDPSGDAIDYGAYYSNPWPFLHSQTTNNNEFIWLNNGVTGDNRYWMKDYATANGYFPTERGALFSTGENNANPKPSEVNNLFIAGTDEYPGTGRYRYPYGMDMYCWYEPEPHWVNFKRNGPNHWHSDEYDPANHLHAHLAYTEYNIAEGNDIPNQNEDDLVIGKGYMASISIATYMQSHGQLSKTNDNVALERTVTAKADGNIAGWNLVGNPFHAYLDFAKFANETGNENASSNYDLLAKEGNSPFYVVYDADKYESSPGSAFRYYPQGGSSGGDYAGRYLHPHQGFFVKVLSSSGTLKYDESMIVARSTLNFDDDGLDGHFRNGHVDDGSPTYPLVNLYLSSERGCADITVIEFNRPEWDGAHKLKELRQGNGLFYGHHDGRNYAALFAKEGAERVPLWFEAKEHDVFTMKWNTANADFRSMYLVDNLTGIKYNMLAHDSYTFEGNIHDYPSRFYITFKFNEGPQDEEEPEDDDGNTETHTQFAFLDGSQWVVTGEGIIDFIDLQGRVLLRTQVDGQSHVSLPNVTTGLYMFRLSSSHDVKVQKVIITNN